jgi:hypothetical protein
VYVLNNAAIAVARLRKATKVLPNLANFLFLLFEKHKSVTVRSHGCDLMHSMSNCMHNHDIVIS